jgi:hypothetical protein
MIILRDNTLVAEDLFVIERVHILLKIQKKEVILKNQFNY